MTETLVNRVCLRASADLLDSVLGNSAGILQGGCTMYRIYLNGELLFLHAIHSQEGYVQKTHVDAENFFMHVMILAYDWRGFLPQRCQVLPFWEMPEIVLWRRPSMLLRCCKTGSTPQQCNDCVNITMRCSLPGRQSNLLPSGLTRD